MKVQILGLKPEELKNLSQVEVITRLYETNAQKNGGRFMSDYKIKQHAEKAKSFKNSSVPLNRIFERTKAKASRLAADRINGEVVRDYGGSRQSYRAIAIITSKDLKALEPLERIELELAKLEEAEIQLQQIFGRVRIQAAESKKSNLLPRGIREKFSEIDQLRETLADVRDHRALLERRKTKEQRKEAAHFLASSE